ncbi:MAG: RNA polymerase sigma factor [Xanthobacteraceae bacterium]|nr:RNA polymerase sigma factor [Xanthobacteraceae bacterium]
MAVAAADITSAVHRIKVRGVLLRLVKDASLADDLLQETLLRAMRTTAQPRGDASPTTWLTAIALNVARDHFRAVRRMPAIALLDDAADVPDARRPDSDLLQGEMSDCILNEVARLPPHQRDVVLLYHVAGLGHSEIAERMAITEGHARVLLHRGQVALRDMLAHHCRLDFGDTVPCERRTSSAR